MRSCLCFLSRVKYLSISLSLSLSLSLSFLITFLCAYYIHASGAVTGPGYNNIFLGSDLGFHVDGWGPNSYIYYHVLYLFLFESEESIITFLFYNINMTILMNT